MDGGTDTGFNGGRAPKRACRHKSQFLCSEIDIIYSILLKDFRKLILIDLYAARIIVIFF
jgi:hypothetical protein